MTDLINKARMFATAAHRAIDHKRKYTGECYTAHLKEVSGLVERYGGSPDMIAAAWLHDVVEDTGVTLDDLSEFFPGSVVSLVFWLTEASKPEDGNRAVRKAIDAEHLSKAPVDAQTIKYCDLISNTASISMHDPKFAKVYLQEKRLLLKVMTRGDARLYEIASAHAKGEAA